MCESLSNLSSDFFSFIEEHINDDPNLLRLKNFKGKNFDVKFAILQIECLQRIKHKLPELYNTRKFLFSSVLATEQCTSEKIAKFHASLFNQSDSVLDMTAGLCVDSFYLASKVSKVTSIEISPETAEIAKFNMNKNSPNVKVFCCDSIEYINDNTKFDAIFVDPARRGENNKRLFAISDCSPNIIANLQRIQKVAKVLYVKTSPMIDITKSIIDIPQTSDIWIISINNECKELLFKVDLEEKDDRPTPIIHTINYEGENIQEFSFTFTNYIEKYGEILCNSYLYEPNSSLMKSGRTSALHEKYDISKLNPNTHLFTSTNYYDEFPGRKFKIISIIPFKSKEIKFVSKSYPQINVSTRNFIMKSEELKKKLKIKDGGNKYLFGVKDINNALQILICEKI